MRFQIPNSRFQIGVLCWLLAAGAWAQTNLTTPVFFNALHFNGQGLGKKMTITPSAETLLQTDGTNVITGGPITLSPGAAGVTNNLWPGKYSVSIEGIAKAWTIQVPAGWTNAAPAIAARLSTNLVTVIPPPFVSVYDVSNYVVGIMAYGTAANAGGLVNGALSLGPSYDGWGWQLGNIPADVLFWLDPSGVLLSTPTNTTPNAVVGSDYAGYLRYSQIGVGNDGKLYADAAGLTNAPWSNSRSGLLAAAMGGQYQFLTVSYDTNGIPTNAMVQWPDQTYGVWTGTNLNYTFFSADGYTVTYTNTGVLISQPTMLRDDKGNVTNAPALLIYP